MAAARSALTPAAAAPRSARTPAAAAPHLAFADRSGPRSLGAYGLRLEGVEAAQELLVPAPVEWPSLELTTRAGGGRPPLQWVRREEARLALQGGGWVDVDWTRGRAVFTVPSRPTASELVHPYLAPVAGLAAHRAGRESFHAGAVAIGDGAWGVLGDKGAGKSSLLAWLALGGHPLLADDVLVVDEQGRALAGPRSIDLRREAATRLGAGEWLGVVGARERYRFVTEEAPAELPLRGFVVLAWGTAVGVSPLGASRRVAELAGARAARLAPAEPSRLLELSALPMLELRRPRRWEAAGGAADALLDALAG